MSKLHACHFNNVHFDNNYNLIGTKYIVTIVIFNKDLHVQLIATFLMNQLLNTKSMLPIYHVHLTIYIR